LVPLSVPLPSNEIGVVPDEGRLLALARGSPHEREAALQGLHARYHAEVRGFLTKLLRDPALAEDALQESFLAVYSAFDSYDASRPFRPWLFQIVRNAGLRSLRSRKKDDRLSRAGARPEATSGPVAEAEAREETALAREALAALPDETRALLLQRHGLGMKLEDLARSFAVTDRTVRNRLRAAAHEFALALLKRKSAKGGSP
jgi:RNA polymerase sigma factor (sigma-70 family)